MLSLQKPLDVFTFWHSRWEAVVIISIAVIGWCLCIILWLHWGECGVSSLLLSKKTEPVMDMDPTTVFFFFRADETP